MGLGVLAIVAKQFGGAEDNLQPGWTKLRELDARVARSPTHHPDAGA